MTDETSREILAELQRQTAILSSRSRRINVVAIILFGLFLLAVYCPRSWRPRTDATAKATKQGTDSWQEVSRLMDCGQLDDAKEMLHGLIQKYPDYHYGYALLGSLHQQLGKFSEAETNYIKACELFPDEDNEKTLAAIRKAIAAKKGTANQRLEATAASAGSRH